ncbi:MAG: aminotransferase class IV [Phycisphaerales bacterium]
MIESRKVWLNGSLVDERAATISVFDRGFLFGDGVYELVRFFRCASNCPHRRIGDGMDLHVARLERSLRLAEIRGFAAVELPRICDAVLDANDLDDAAVYVQITRGAGPTRSHVPQAPLTPTVLATATPCEPIERFAEPASVRAITREDLRWSLCQIKTISLMGNILALLDADRHGATEAILHRGGVVSEGAYTNVFAAIGDTLVTPPVDAEPPILHGVTRAQILATAEAAGLAPTVRPLHLDELQRADEVLITSSRRLVSAVVELDGVVVGDGTPGRAARALFEAMRRRIAHLCGFGLPTFARNSV